jgi:CSLREA domain-containing protein
MGTGRLVLTRLSQAVLTGLVSVTTTIAQSPGVSAAVTITVNTTADEATPNGNCTLREAITASNTNAVVDSCPAGSDTEADTIGFDIPGEGPHTIAVSSALGPLPSITQAVVIDGTTDPVVELDGSGLDPASFPAADGLRVDTTEVAVKRLVINDFPDAGVELNGGANSLSGSYIGTDVTGLSAEGNQVGVRVTAGLANLIGGSAASERNVISGNDSAGIAIRGSARNTSIVGNYVGLGVDGYTEVGNGGSGVEIINTAPDGNLDGVFIEGSAGERNVISGNFGDGVYAEGPGVRAVHIAGSYVGLSADGEADKGNDGDGVEAFQTSGGFSVVNSVVSGNGGYGAKLRGTSPAFLLRGNFIGTDKDGTTAIGNLGGGAIVEGEGVNVGGFFGVTPGGDCTGSCNLVSGNAGPGLIVASSGTSLLTGNYVGTDVTGLADLGNSSHGVVVRLPVYGGLAIGLPAEDNRDRNIISGNDGDGVVIEEAGSIWDASLRSNYVGVGTDGTTPLGNTGNGVTVQSAGNNIGTLAYGAGNIIAHNGANGVQISGSAADGNEVSGNSLYSNAGLGIDLDPLPSTPNPNDAGDSDTGPNEEQNYPVLRWATTGADTTIAGTLVSSPNHSFQLEFFSSPSCDPSGYGEAETFLGLTSVTTDGKGRAGFRKTFEAVIPAGHVVTATATDAVGDAVGNTSELSPCRVVTPTVTIGDKAVREGDSRWKTMRFNVTLSAPSNETISVNFFTRDGTATAPSDYRAKVGSVLFSPGETSKTIGIRIRGDLRREPDETFKVKLSDPVNVRIADRTGWGTIRNDD